MPPAKDANANIDWGRTWTGWAILTIFGLFFSLQSIAAGAAIPEAVTAQMLRFQLWVPAIPLQLWISHRFRFTRARWLPALAVHLVTAFVTIPLHAAIYLPLLRWLRPSANPSVINDVIHCVFIYILSSSIVYAGTYNLQWRNAEVRSAQLEAQLAVAELSALRMQLEPHFLFNTLQAISTLITANPPLARQMVHQLADLMRATMASSGDPKVPLADELERLRLYLAIERTRFDSRLHVDWDIAGDLEQALVPNLLLQPLVENAVKHGIGQRLDGGRIKVGVSASAARLQITIADNGPGLRPQSADSTGVGLNNTRRRLATLYPAEHRFEILEPPGGGVQATLEIPLEWAR